MRCADYVFHFLADSGVRDVFMVSGGGAMFLNDALGSEKRIRVICNHHEQGAAIAAEGYARVSGKIAVVSVTTGPGGTNALTGVIGEYLDSVPVLYLSGQVKRPTCRISCPDLPLRQLGDQEINIVDIVRPVTKYAVTVTDPARIRAELEKALRIAVSGRPGPVWLDIPIDVQSAEVDPDTLSGDTENCASPVQPVPDVMRKIVQALSEARSPAVIAGRGIRIARAEAELETLIRRLQIPVLSTFGAMDLLPSDDPLLAGPIGTIGSRAGNIVLQNADFILSIGSRNNIRQTSYNPENFARNAKTFVSVDLDEAELRKPTFRPTLPVCCDAGEFLRELNRILPDDLPDFSRWTNWCRERKKAYPPVREEWKHTEHGVNPYFFTRLLTSLLPEKAVVSCANATPSLALFQAGIVRRGQKMFCNSGCAAMGYGFPAALGASAACRNGETVVCLDGDGSFMMNLQELQTFRQTGFPLKLFLYNNGEYASIRQTQDNFFAGRHTGCDRASGVTFPDWEKLSAAFGVRYVRITSSGEAERLLPEILSAGEFVFCDVLLTPGYQFEPKLSSRRLPDGTIVSPSLEDMSPFLPPEEMVRNCYQS